MHESIGQYTALIGDTTFVNVEKPIVINGNNLIEIERTSSGAIVVTTEVKNEKGELVLSIERGEIKVEKPDLLVRQHDTRMCVVDDSNRRVIVDMLESPKSRNYDFALRMVTYHKGYPILMHPDRTKFGCLNNGNRPNMIDQHWKPKDDPSGPVMNIEENDEWHLRGTKIENYNVAFKVNI